MVFKCHLPRVTHLDNNGRKHEDLKREGSRTRFIMPAATEPFTTPRFTSEAVDHFLFWFICNLGEGAQLSIVRLLKLLMSRENSC